jgi:plastocyanin
MTAYITYEMDFIAKEKADALGIQPAHTMWLDVRNGGYPVFNVQREFGGKDGKCTWPDEQCADFDPWGNTIPGQGEPGPGQGTALRLPERGEPLGPIDSFTGGTLIGLGGHLHPGGLTDDIDLVRDGRSKRIFTSEAIYWDHEDPAKPTGPPTSWDLSMTVTGLPFWGIRVEPGDEIRISGTYDTTEAATYENMGIAIGALAPNAADGRPTAPGLDPFKARRAKPKLCRTPFGKEINRCRAKIRLCTSLRTRLTAPVSKLRFLSRRFGISSRHPMLCDRGLPTHGHQEANGNHGGPAGEWNAQPGGAASNVAVANFLYEPGDFSTLSMTGVPQVKLGTNLRFTNVEGSTIYHSVTSCGFPCLGPTGAAFPLSDGATSSGRQVDFDSSELGFGTPVIGPAKQTLNWELPVTREAGYEPGETVTYYCRIHPSMRGAFQVTE